MPRFLYSLNTSTIQPTPLLEKIRVARQAGYDAIELWITDVEAYLAEGGQLATVRQALDDAGLLRPSMIYLKGWCTADQAALATALDLCRQRLETARALGVSRIVAGPPPERVPRSLAVDCYARLLELSLAAGVPASLEFLGFVAGISTLDEAWAICQAVARPEATVTLDAWHLYRGGSSPGLVEQIPAGSISIVHWDDAPAAPPRTAQTDNDRVLPGDGILPLADLAATLGRRGYRGALSLELFHPGYWQQDPLIVARRGLEKMRRSVND